MTTRTHAGITYTAEPAAGGGLRWSGGAKGGAFYERSVPWSDSPFTCGAIRYRTWERAAEVAQKRALKAYRDALATVAAWEA